MFENRRKNIVYFLLIFFSFLLFVSPNRIFSKVRVGVAHRLSYPLRIISYPFKEIKKILYYHRTFNEYIRLTRENNILKSRIIGFEELIRENSRLEKLLEFKRRLIYPSVAANVIGRDPSHWHSSMVIDKGSKDGLAEGMPVVNALGVVGKIAEVAENTSKVILLTDPHFSVAALVQRSRESGLVSGTLKDLSRMSYVEPQSDVRVGDKVITSKLSSHFPEGLMIGEIVRINENPKNETLECEVMPSVSLSQIEEILVVKFDDQP